jgi:hypothetical protein
MKKLGAKEYREVVEEDGQDCEAKREAFYFMRRRFGSF